MSARVFLVVASTSLLLMCPDPARSHTVMPVTDQASAAANLASQIQGRWEVVTINGTAPAEMVGGDMVLVFAGEKYQQLIQGAVTEEGGLKLDPSKTPHHVDLNILTGDDAGKVQLGVVAIKGDQMSVTLGIPGDGLRPASLTAGPLVVVLSRKK
jgi:uncharacterized protein (TIGR03067 family)